MFKCCYESKDFQESEPDLTGDRIQGCRKTCEVLERLSRKQQADYAEHFWEAGFDSANGSSDCPVYWNNGDSANCPLRQFMDGEQPDLEE